MINLVLVLSFHGQDSDCILRSQSVLSFCHLISNDKK